MKQIKCQKCGRIVNNVPDNWDRNFTCNSCGGYFTEIGFIPDIQNTYNQLPQMNQNNYSITEQFRSLGTDIRGNMPRLVIGKKDNVQPNQQINLPSPPNQQTKPIQEPIELKHKRLLNTFEFWTFAVVIALVLGYAAYRLINVLMGG